MASTQITVENRTDIPIHALLTWAGGHIGMVDIEPKPGAGPPPSGSIPCEYVLYDLWIIDQRYGSLTRDITGVVGGTALVKKQAGGGTSWVFDGTELLQR